MTTAIRLAGEADSEQVLSLMARYHDETGISHDDDHRLMTVAPLLAGNPLGAVWLFGPTRAPLGYILISFGWSVAHGGMVGYLEEAYIRESVRGRGIGTEVLHAITVSLRQADLRAMHVQLPPDHRAAHFCARCGFSQVDGFVQMTDTL